MFGLVRNRRSTYRAHDLSFEIATFGIFLQDRFTVGTAALHFESAEIRRPSQNAAAVKSTALKSLTIAVRMSARFLYRAGSAIRARRMFDA